MLTPPEVQPNRSPNEQPVVSWSPRLTVLMFLTVAIVSLVGGGGGAFLSVAGLLQAWHLPGSAMDDPLTVPLYLGAALAAMLSGLFFWWLLIVRPRRLTPERGAWAGMISSVVAHPLTWLFYLGVLALMGVPGYSGPLSGPSGVIVLLFGAGYLSLFSLILVGWFTALLGGLAGAAGALLWMVVTGSDSSAPSRRSVGHDTS